MNPHSGLSRLRTSFSFSVLVPLALLAAGPAVMARENSAEAPIRYTISLAQREKHLVRITLDIPSGPREHDLQLPVWNALYQVRDFSQYVQWVRAEDGTGHPLTLELVNKSRWHVGGTENGAHIEYEAVADNGGPYGAQLNPQHAFFNLAEVLMYPVDSRAAPVQLNFTDIPSGWHIATALASHLPRHEFTAGNYDLSGGCSRRNREIPRA